MSLTSPTINEGSQPLDKSSTAQLLNLLLAKYKYIPHLDSSQYSTYPTYPMVAHTKNIFELKTIHHDTTKRSIIGPLDNTRII